MIYTRYSGNLMASYKKLRCAKYSKLYGIKTGQANIPGYMDTYKNSDVAGKYSRLQTNLSKLKYAREIVWVAE